MERLEFFGDAVLGEFVRGWIYHNLPSGVGPGPMTVLACYIESNFHLSSIYTELNLEFILNLPPAASGVKPRADRMEAIIAELHEKGDPTKLRLLSFILENGYRKWIECGGVPPTRSTSPPKPTPVNNPVATVSPKKAKKAAELALLNKLMSQKAPAAPRSVPAPAPAPKAVKAVSPPKSKKNKKVAKAAPVPLPTKPKKISKSDSSSSASTSSSSSSFSDSDEFITYITDVSVSNWSADNLEDDGLFFI
jgi:hypothetical protein